MIEMDESEYTTEPLSDEEINLIALFDYIRQHGSDELNQIIDIITGGIPPGGKERDAC